MLVCFGVNPLLRILFVLRVIPLVATLIHCDGVLRMITVSQELEGTLGHVDFVPFVVHNEKMGNPVSRLLQIQTLVKCSVDC